MVSLMLTAEIVQAKRRQTLLFIYFYHTVSLLFELLSNYYRNSITGIISIHSKQYSKRLCHCFTMPLLSEISLDLLSLCINFQGSGLYLKYFFKTLCKCFL